MGSRLDLHEILLEIATNAYFQPPSSVVMKYPCVVYERDFVQLTFADNSAYRMENRYKVTVIDKDPDSTIPGEILLELPKCSFDRHFVKDNLHHNVLILYF